MLMRMFPTTRMPRLCNQLSRVAFASMTFTFLSPFPLVASDDVETEIAQTEQKDEGENQSVGESDQKGTDALKQKGKEERPRSQVRKNDRRDKAAYAAGTEHEKKSDGMKSGHRNVGEAPALGVIVGSCPGNAVCVKDVMSGSPADQAGLEEGDYILSINEEQVTSPERLREVLEQMQAEGKVKVRVWRQGDERTEEITLASKADQPPESHRAWLGVMLSHNENEGLTVERVLPGSPASQAGLREEDLIRKLNDKRVKDVSSFLECIEDIGPGSDVVLVIDREGEEQTINAQLGDIEEAPMAFLREAMRHAMHEPNRSNWESDEMPTMIEETLDEMRGRIRSLEKQVKELEGNADEIRSDNASLLLESSRDNLSQIEKSVDGGQETLVVQRGRARNYIRGNAYSPGFRGNSYFNQNPYRSGYRYGGSSFYGNPGFGNSYYQYGGRPYYYGGNARQYGYGARSGIQIGRNFGVFW